MFHSHIAYQRGSEVSASHLQSLCVFLCATLCWIEWHEHKLHTDNFFSSPDLFDNLKERKIYCWRTVKRNTKIMSKYLMPWTSWLKLSDIQSTTRGDLTSKVWRDKPDVCILTNMCPPPTNDNMCNELGSPIQPEFIQDYNRRIGYVNLTGRDDEQLLNTNPGIKVDKKFSYFLCMTTLNSFLLLTVYGTKMTHSDFQICLVQNLIKRPGSLPHPHQPVGRPCVEQKQVIQLEVNFDSHSPFPTFRLYSQLFCMRNKRKSLSQVQEVWYGTVPWWVFSRSPYKIETVLYQEVMTGHQKLKTFHQIGT